VSTNSVRIYLISFKVYFILEINKNYCIEKRKKAEEKTKPKKERDFNFGVHGSHRFIQRT